MAAAKVGGIHANNAYPADFIHDNLGIALNLIHAAFESEVRKLLFLGSVVHLSEAGAPADHRGGAARRSARAHEPMVCGGEDRRPDAVPSLSPATWGGLHLADADEHLRSGGQLPSGEQPCGRGADPALARGKACRRAERRRLGYGNAAREFLFVDDLADAVVFALENYSAESHLNVGTGEDIAIAEFARLIANGGGIRGAAGIRYVPT